MERIVNHQLCCSVNGSERLWIAWAWETTAWNVHHTDKKTLRKHFRHWCLHLSKNWWKNYKLLLFAGPAEKRTCGLKTAIAGIKRLSEDVLAFNHLYSYYLKMDVKRDVFCNESCLFLIHSIYLFLSQGSVSLVWHFEVIFCLFLNSTFAKWADKCVLRNGNVQETLF